MTCTRCHQPDPNGDYWLGLCQMCWEAECTELWRLGLSFPPGG